VSPVRKPDISRASELGREILRVAVEDVTTYLGSDAALDHPNVLLAYMQMLFAITMSLANQRRG
jgi:hypothetical protein